MVELVIIYRPVGRLACQADFLMFFRLHFYEISELKLPEGLSGSEAKLLNDVRRGEIDLREKTKKRNDITGNSSGLNKVMEFFTKKPESIPFVLKTYITTFEQRIQILRKIFDTCEPIIPSYNNLLLNSLIQQDIFTLYLLLQ